MLLTLLATAAAADGIAAGAELTLEQLARAQLQPSAFVDLLGPIAEAGRVGWDCAPERAARARTARGAELPVDDR